ncbi:MAG: hypothetical protein K6F53_03675 [Lachnospiraceae bacterium]|nr:hypothetical protein [Lachnospiraceae bacterium]
MAERFFNRVYGYDQGEKLFLSPYCSICFDERGLIIWQQLFDRTLKLRCEKELADNMLDLLSGGCTKDALRASLLPVMSEAEADLFIDECMRTGIIE